MPGPQGPRRHVKFDRADRRKKQPDNSVKPEFKLSERTQSGSRLWVILGMLAIVGLSAYAVHSWLTRPDPHYLNAKRLVDTYESGRAPTARNYNNTIYDQALGELDLVEPESVSAPAAAELRADILHGREAFLARRAERNPVDKATVVTKRQERIQRNVEAYRRARANPQTEFPECEDEKEHGGHKH